MSDKKSATAVTATKFLEDIILERYLINIIPKNRQYSFSTIKKLTGYNFLPIRGYIKSDLFAINEYSIEITDNTQLLLERSKNYCEKLIKKIVYPALYKYNDFIYRIERLLDSSYYTAEEKSFIDLILDKLFCIINNNIALKPISHKDLLEFNSIYSNGFNYVARDIYNAIIQKKLHAGDDILSFINHRLKDNNVKCAKLESSSKFDYFFTKDAILKCDLNTNINILIKNFLNLSFYNLSDTVTKVILLSKLNSIHPFLIKDKIFENFE